MDGKIVQVVGELFTSHYGLPALTSGDLDQMRKKKNKGKKKHLNTCMEGLT